MRILSLFLLLLVPLRTAIADDPYLFILGIAQDAGYPQAGCYRPHCLPGWANTELRRLAVSVAAIDPASGTKYLFDATPDLPEQLYRLHREAPDERFTLNGVFLTHAHIGHYAGLMYLGREAIGARNIPVYAMPRMREFLRHNGPWEQLVDLENIELFALQDGEAVQPAKGLQVRPFQVPHRDEYSETVGFRIDGPNRSALYIPDIDSWDDWKLDFRKQVQGVDYALVDATFFADGELPGRDMSEIPHPRVRDSMSLLDDLSAAEKSRVIFIHMNHTNPLLIDDSSARSEVLRRGFRIAEEGMRLPL